MPRPESLLETPRQRFDPCGGQAAACADRRRSEPSCKRAEAAAGRSPATRHLAAASRAVVGTASAQLVSRLNLRPIEQEQARGQKADLGARGRSLNAAQALRVERQRQQLAATGRQLDILSYKATLARGYAVVRSGEEIVTSRARAAEAAALSIEFADGRFDLDGKAKVPTADTGRAAAPKGETGKTGETGGGGDQGSLF